MPILRPFYFGKLSGIYLCIAATKSDDCAEPDLDLYLLPDAEVPM